MIFELGARSQKPRTPDTQITSDLSESDLFATEGQLSSAMMPTLSKLFTRLQVDWQAIVALRESWI